MPTAAALVARLVTALAVVAAVLCCLHPSAGTLAATAAPVVTVHLVPAPPLPATRHCWVEHKADADGGDETVEGDPAQAAPYSTPVPCSS